MQHPKPNIIIDQSKLTICASPSTIFGYKVLAIGIHLMTWNTNKLLKSLINLILVQIGMEFFRSM